MHYRFLLVLSILIFLQPMTASAYLSPEQVFGGGNTTGNPPPPPTPREGEERQQEQQRQSTERREAEQKELLRPNYLEPQDTYVPPAATSQKIDPYSDDARYQKRMEKLNEQKNSPTIIIGGNGSVVDSKGNVLHSGAPLVSQTGPESVLMLALIGIAAISTLLYAFVRT